MRTLSNYFNSTQEQAKKLSIHNQLNMHRVLVGDSVKINWNGEQIWIVITDRKVIAGKQVYYEAVTNASICRKYSELSQEFDFKHEDIIEIHRYKAESSFLLAS